MSRLPIIIISVIGIIVLIVVLAFFGILPGRKDSQGPVTLTFWGFGDDESVWAEVIARFKDANPNISVAYLRFPEETYEDMLINRLAEGRGPDIFMLKSSWLRSHRDKMYPLLQSRLGFSSRDFEQLFVDGVIHDLQTKEGEILGFPLFLDTLGLFYNKDLFNASGIATFPKNWDEVADASQKITRRSPAGEISRSGIAMGAFHNIEHAFEIVSALMLQSGDLIIRIGAKDEVSLGAASVDAFTLYTSYATPGTKNFSWSLRTQASSLDAFAEGKAGMVLGFWQDRARIVAKNPHLNFGVLPFPQQKNAPVSLTYGSYMFSTVSRMSLHPEEAWKFVLFASTGDAIVSYLEAIDQIPARRDLLSQGGKSSERDIFYRQALIAKTWPVPDEKKTKNLFKEAVDAVIAQKTPPTEAMNRMREQLSLLIQ